MEVLVEARARARAKAVARMAARAREKARQLQRLCWSGFLSLSLRTAAKNCSAQLPKGEFRTSGTR